MTVNLNIHKDAMAEIQQLSSEHQAAIIEFLKSMTTKARARDMGGEQIHIGDRRSCIFWAFYVEHFRLEFALETVKPRRATLLRVTFRGYKLRDEVRVTVGSLTYPIDESPDYSAKEKALQDPIDSLAESTSKIIGEGPSIKHV